MNHRKHHRRPDHRSERCAGLEAKQADGCRDDEFEKVRGADEDRGPGDAARRAVLAVQKGMSWIIGRAGGGYGVLGDDGSCPARTFGDVIVSGKDCEARSEAACELAGTVLPFRVHRAGKLRGISGSGRVEGYASVAVTGGSMEDWLATGVYVAEQTVTGDVTFAQVKVFLENPWGDASPTRSKNLARVRFSPIPSGPPLTGTWSILGASHPTSVASIHWDILVNALLDPDLRRNPRRRGESAETAATRIVRDLYGLPQNWEQPISLGIRGPHRPRENIKVTVPPLAEVGVGTLRACVTSDCRAPRTLSGLEGIR